MRKISLGRIMRVKEDSFQFFKEEKKKDVVYNVYLKKIRYNTPEDVRSIFRPAPTDDSNSQFYLSIAAREEEKASYLQWRLEEIRVLKAGSLDQLVEHLSSPSGELDSTYVSVFLATYRTFSSPKQVVNLIQERYKVIEKDAKMKSHVKSGHRKCIKTVLKIWLETYKDDFNEPPNYPTLTSLISFAKNHLKEEDMVEKLEYLAGELSKNDPSFGPIVVEDFGPQLGIGLGPVVTEMELSDKDYYYKFTSFDEIQPDVFAQQLTCIDAELFRRVQPHHCLGAVWSRRDKNRGQTQSVMATVNQFNAVSYRVVAIILKNPQDISEENRALIIEKWIEIAQELRKIKNFSSLMAIHAALKSNSIYRLKGVWSKVSKEKMELFEEHSEIFSEDNNQKMSRELLIMEGTAKFADPETTNTIRGYKRRQSIFGTAQRRKSTFFEVPPIVQGTVPYLGTFLTDLTMIDTATPNTTADGLINFEKKRKEFEVLAQIRMLQSAASQYSARPLRGFIEWFQNIRIYDEKESYELSYGIEPQAIQGNVKDSVKSHKKKPSWGFFVPKSPFNSPTAPPSPSTSEDRHSVDSGLDSLHDKDRTPRPIHHSKSTGSLTSDPASNTSSPWNAPETKVVRVIMECPELDSTSHYKSILLTNNDHTKTVISNILLKFNVAEGPDNFTISQILPDGELQIPDKGNVFYAINTSVPDVKFVIRKKADVEKLSSKPPKGKTKKKLFIVG